MKNITIKFGGLEVTYALYRLLKKLYSKSKEGDSVVKSRTNNVSFTPELKKNL